jgi:hypothetical protein
MIAAFLAARFLILVALLVIAGALAWTTVADTD